MIDHGSSGRVDFISTEMSGLWFFAVRTERTDDESVVSASVLNPLDAELAVSLVRTRRHFALD
jgi:hypothetical protein